MTGDGAELHSRDFWLFRLFPLHAVIPAAIIGVGVAFLAIWIGASIPVGAAIGAVLALVGLIQVRGTTVLGFVAKPVGYFWSKRRRAAPEPGAAFDVPLPEGGAYGVRWDGGCLTTMLRIDSPPKAIAFLSPGTLETDHVVPLAEAWRSGADSVEPASAVVELSGLTIVATASTTRVMNSCGSTPSGSSPRLIRSYWARNSVFASSMGM